MKLRDLVTESNSFEEEPFTDEQEIAFWERKARAVYANNHYIINKWSSSPYVSTQRSQAFSNTKVDQIYFHKIIREFATAKDNEQIQYYYFDPTKIPPHILQKVRKDEQITLKQAEVYPSLVAKVKRLRQKAEAKIKFDPSTLPAKIPIPGTTKAFNNPAVTFKEEQYAGPASVFSWPGIPRAFFYDVSNFLRKCGVEDFDIVYSGKGAKTLASGTKVRNHIIAVAANGNIIWNCNNQWAGTLYMPDDTMYSVEETIRPYMINARIDSLVKQRLEKSIDNFKKSQGKI